MARIYIDNAPYTVPDGLNLLDACLSLGFNIPYFCWHPAMGSVGACRQCAVKVFKDEKDNKGRIVMSCMTPAADGTRLSIDDEEVRRFRAGVIEMLMANHPHDCPVCDEGGECHLQDMTVMTGHTYRRYRFPKRTYRNQYLGPLVNHELNRCIQCYRCVRYYRDFAGGDDLNVFAAHNHVYFGRDEDGVLQNEFSGNLVEVCPTGVFTDKTLKRHYTRPWDLQTAPSICVHCGLGCNTIPGERYRELRRIRNRYNGQVNGYFLCDRGRYGYEFVNHEKRIREAPPNAVEDARKILDGRVIGIGSPRASLESNFALRALVGPENFYCGMADLEYALVRTALDLLRKGRARTPSLRDLESADAMLILGEDLTNSAPMSALSIRLWMRNRPTPEQERLQIPLWNQGALGEIRHEQCSLFIVSPYATKLDDAAAATLRAKPEDIARLAFAVAHELDAAAPAVDVDHAAREFVNRVAECLRGAKKPMIVSGVSSGSRAVLDAAAQVANALDAASLSLTVPECNSLGAAWMGGGKLSEAFARTARGEVDAAVILENDLYRRAPKTDVDAFFDSCPKTTALDHLENATTRQATMALPAGTFAESDGTFINNEGRAQRFFQVFVPNGDVRESWRWLAEIGEQPWRNLDDVIEAVAWAIEDFAPIRDAAPGADFRVEGMRVAREPHRYSGRTAMSANLTVHEPKPPSDPDSPLDFSMEGINYDVPPPLIPFFWAPGWNSPQAVTKFQQEINGALRGGDPGVRLIEPKDARPQYAAPPRADDAPSEHMVAVPVQHIFGTDELSMHSAGIAELAPAPYIAMHPEDAAAAGIKEGAQVKLTIGGAAIEWPLKLDAGFARGVVGVPVGLPDTPALALPALVKVGGAAQ